MIGMLIGRVAHKTQEVAVVVCGGVGYEAHVPVPVSLEMPEGDENVTLHTHLAISDDAHRLFGFLTIRDRDLFRQLIKINGVGPKVALAILSTLETGQLIQCVQEKDAKTLTGVPGIGKKGAEKIIVDLDGKLDGLGFESMMTGKSKAPVNSEDINGFEDAKSALISLGYKAIEAEKAIKAVATPDMEVRGLIHAALKQAVKA